MSVACYLCALYVKQFYISKKRVKNREIFLHVPGAVQPAGKVLQAFAGLAIL